MFGCGDDWTEDAIWLQLWLDRCRDGVWGCENVWTDVIWLQGWLDRCLRLWKCLNRCHLVTGMTGQVFEVVQMFEQLSFGYTYRDDWTGVWGCGNDWTDVVWLKWWLERGCLRCGNDWTDVVWCDDDWTGVWGCGSGWTDVIWLQWWLVRGCLRVWHTGSDRTYVILLQWLDNGHGKDWTCCCDCRWCWLNTE